MPLLVRRKKKNINEERVLVPIRKEHALLLKEKLIDEGYSVRKSNKNIENQNFIIYEVAGDSTGGDFIQKFIDKIRKIM